MATGMTIEERQKALSELDFQPPPFDSAKVEKCGAQDLPVLEKLKCNQYNDEYSEKAKVAYKVAVEGLWKIVEGLFSVDLTRECSGVPAVTDVDQLGKDVFVPTAVGDKFSALQKCREKLGGSPPVESLPAPPASSAISGVQLKSSSPLQQPPPEKAIPPAEKEQVNTELPKPDPHPLRGVEVPIVYLNFVATHGWLSVFGTGEEPENFKYSNVDITEGVSETSNLSGEIGLQYPVSDILGVGAALQVNLIEGAYPESAGHFLMRYKIPRLEYMFWKSWQHGVSIYGAFLVSDAIDDEDLNFAQRGGGDSFTGYGADAGLNYHYQFTDDGLKVCIGAEVFWAVGIAEESNNAENWDFISDRALQGKLGIAY